ncbi:RNA polymerase III transcription factor IIIC subunit-domain-containing protein [Sporodiniella umbellata]|nr:RNA polymerase III transcription factor IIIC subunit-domain-containing protein [Sporodiniella umbellata]
MSMKEHEIAPIIPIANKKFLCIEYPGVVKRVKRAIQTLGGEQLLAQALAADLPVNLWFRPEDRFSHPIQGNIMKITKLVAKVTRRVKKSKLTGEIIETENDWKIEIVGYINRAVRFRNMADAQYLVPENNELVQLKHSLDVGNVKSLMNFDFLPEAQDPGYGARSIPPPIFSTRLVTTDYGYRQNAPVLRVKVKQPDGSYKIGLINRSRRIAMETTYVKFEVEKVPTESWQRVTPSADPIILEGIEIVKELFEKRPIWSRAALNAQLDPRFHSVIKKIAIHVSYLFVNGPYRECWIKYGVDPRKSPEYYIYQVLNARIAQRGQRNQTYRKAPVVVVKKGFAKNTERSEDKKDEETSTPYDVKHIFDGKTLGKNSAYQVCDFTDPQLVSILNNPDYMKESCSLGPGYYYASVYNYARELMRTKNELIKQNLPSETTVLSHEEILKLIHEEKEKQSEKSQMLEAEKAISEAEAQSKEPGSSEKLKESVKNYIEEYDKLDEEYMNDDGNDSDLELSDAFDEYDEELDVFRDGEMNENQEEQSDPMEIDVQTSATNTVNEE